MKLTRSTPDIKLVIGGESRIALLPPEVAARVQAKATRRALIGVVVIAVAITGAGYGYATFTAASSATELASAQATTSSLLAAQTDFVEVRKVQGQLDAVTAGQQVATASEINWNSYLGAIVDSLPENVVLTNVKVDVESPTEMFPAATLPLQGPRVGTIEFEALTAGIPDVQAWLDSLSTIPGFVDATPGSISADLEGFGYTSTVSMHFNSDAFSKRYAADATTTEEGTK